MKNRLFFPVFIFICICIITGSCAKEEGGAPIDINRPAFEDALVFTASKQTVGLFENMSFDLKTNKENNDKGGLAYYIGIRLDSVVWQLPEIFDETFTGTRMPINQPQCFYLPGKYQAKATGYRDSLVISRDSAIVEVKLTGDFLGINWNIEEEEITSRSFKFTSSVQGFTLDLFHAATTPPYMLLTYKINIYSGREKFKEEMEAIRPFFYNYITSLYGESVFNYEKEDITQTPLGKEYAERFNYALKDSVAGNRLYYPLTLWDTPACYIALLGSLPSETGEISVPYYKIVAEPVKIHF